MRIKTPEAPRFNLNNISLVNTFKLADDDSISGNNH